MRTTLALDDELVARANETNQPEQKPHGRRAWNLYLEHGCKVDVSVMPLAPEVVP